MKQISHPAILTVFLLFSLHSVASARLLPPHQVVEQVKINIGITHADSSINTQEDDLFTLMGREECNEKDEDCMRRRMVAEAHLDYIYTQHHKPKESP
ncbi:phytosulfokines 2-like [Diospyros lotus]|uniref:phytosulfokines 2-like n=1 Tax=Diospyros lotus TaxID=55363 RepID=UPI002259EDBE|nr:phytosulfokines 2-like [Diospyros lotus]